MKFVDYQEDDVNSIPALANVFTPLLGYLNVSLTTNWHNLTYHTFHKCIKSVQIMIKQEKVTKNCLKEMYKLFKLISLHCWKFSVTLLWKKSAWNFPVTLLMEMINIWYSKNIWTKNSHKFLLIFFLSFNVFGYLRTRENRFDWIYLRIGNNFNLKTLLNNYVHNLNTTGG